MVYILFGASGSGKTTMLEILRDEYSNISVHVKGTTRERRQYDDEEIEYYQSGLPEKYDYIYSQYGYDYGIEKSQILNAISNKINHFIICNDAVTVEKLKHDFPKHVKAIFLYFDAPKEAIRSIQQAREISDDEIDLRINKYDTLKDIFLTNANLFDEIINNTYGKVPAKSLKNQISRILHNDNNDTTPIQELLDLLKKQERSEMDKSIYQKELLFIIMSMQEDDPDINTQLENIFITIKNAAELSGFIPARVDETFGFNTINAKILKHIELSEIIIADLTYERPNCYYELGFAHGKNKNVILTACRGTRIHFDVSNYNIIFYDNMKHLDGELKKHLNEYIKVRQNECRRHRVN